MNPVLPILLGGAALYAYASRTPGKRIDDGAVVKGGRYVAVYAVPPGFPIADQPTLDKLTSILPPDSSVEVDGAKLIITMTAVSSQRIGDIPTPLGTIQLVSLRRLSDVVSGVLPPPSYYTFSWWEQRPGVGYVFSGWKAPKVLSWQTMNAAVSRLSPSQKFPQVLMWEGSRWVSPP